MKKVKRGSCCISTNTWENSQPVFPISCKYVFSHSCWILLLSHSAEVYLRKINISLSSSNPLLLWPAQAVNHKTPAGMCIYTCPNKIKITPFSAHTPATTVTFQANNQVSPANPPQSNMLPQFGRLNPVYLLLYWDYSHSKALQLRWTLPRLAECLYRHSVMNLSVAQVDILTFWQDGKSKDRHSKDEILINNIN